MDMIERVARAIYAESYRRCCNGESPAPDDESWESYIGEARAAIEAMRKPTEEMREAGFASIEIVETSYGAGIPLSAPEKVWSAMIDAALARTQDREG